MKHKIVKLIVASACLVFSSEIICSSQEISLDVMNENASDNYCEVLQKHITLLRKFNTLNKKKKIIDLMPFLVRNIEYKDKIIQQCIKKMVETASIDPLFKTWEYAYELCISQEDMNFVREFSILIFSVYENLLIILTASRTDKEMKGTLEDIIQVYNAVSELPIKEILITLEKCYILFSKILKDYGALSNMRVMEWLRKYWWLPPTIAVAIIGALLGKKISKGILWGKI